MDFFQAYSAIQRMFCHYLFIFSNFLLSKKFESSLLYDERAILPIFILSWRSIKFLRHYGCSTYSATNSVEGSLTYPATILHIISSIPWIHSQYMLINWRINYTFILLNMTNDTTLWFCYWHPTYSAFEFNFFFWWENNDSAHILLS